MQNCTNLNKIHLHNSKTRKPAISEQRVLNNGVCVYCVVANISSYQNGTEEQQGGGINV